MNIKDQLNAEKLKLDIAIRKATNEFTETTGITVDHISIDQSVIRDANGNPFVEFNEIRIGLDC